MFRIKELKRAIAFAMTITMMLSVAGCGNGAEQEAIPDTAEPVSEENEAAEVTEIETGGLDEAAEEPEATEEPVALTYVEENGLEYTDEWGFQTTGLAMNSFDHADNKEVDVWFEISDISVEDSEEDGFKTYVVVQDITGYRWFDGRKKLTDVMFPSVAVADSYTGIIVPSEMTLYDETTDEFSIDVEWEGKTYHISYTEEAEWDFENEWKPLSDGNFAGWCTAHNTLTITVPEDYDGLTLFLSSVYSFAEPIGKDKYIMDYWEDKDNYLFNVGKMAEENEKEDEASATATSTTTDNAKTDKTEAASTPTTTPKQEETKTQTVKETPKPAHTHSYNGTVTANPTCGNNGTKTFTCSCGDSYTESIPATGHQWETRTETIVHPSQGHMESTPIERNIFHCDDCGGDFDGLDAYMGHSCGGSGGGSFSWTTETTYESTWVVDVPETTEVITISTCSVCGATQ